MNWPLFRICFLGLGVACASTRVFADDLLRLYVGAAIGQSDVRASKEINGDTDFDFDFDARHAGWKATVGVRPIAPLGAELQYIDFGNASNANAVGGFGGLSQVDEKAVTLFGLGYLPIPVPFLDVYGKLGIARLHAAATEVPPVPSCPLYIDFCSPASAAFKISSSTTGVAFGAGVQGKIASLAIRAEYERINAAGNRPDLLSLGITWTF